MGWFTRKSKNIHTPTDQKKDTPGGFWHKTPSGNIVDRDDLEGNCWVSEEDSYHFRIGSKEYFSIVLPLAENAGNLDVSIFQLDGKLVKTISSLVAGAKISTTGIGAGTYLLETRIGEKIFSGKLIIE